MNSYWSGNCKKWFVISWISKQKNVWDANWVAFKCHSMVVTWHQQSGVFQPFWCHHIFEHTLIAVLLKAHSRIPNKHILTYPRSDIWYEHIHMLTHPVVMSFGVGFKTNIFVGSFVIFNHLIEFLQHSGFKSAKPCRTWCLQGSFAACKGLVRQWVAGPRLQKWVKWKVKPRELLKETGDGRQVMAVFGIFLV